MKQLAFHTTNLNKQRAIKKTIVLNVSLKFSRISVLLMIRKAQNYQKIVGHLLCTKHVLIPLNHLILNKRCFKE